MTSNLIMQISSIHHKSHDHDIMSETSEICPKPTQSDVTELDLDNNQPLSNLSNQMSAEISSDQPEIANKRRNYTFNLNPHHYNQQT